VEVGEGVEEEVETVAEAPLALSEAVVAIEVAVSVGVEVTAAAMVIEVAVSVGVEVTAAAVVVVVDLVRFESFGMYLVNPVLSSLC
jgi:hypothetical protein